MSEQSAREALRELVRRHSYRPSLARGVERCACGEGAVGQPGWHAQHVADVLLPVVVAEKAAAWLDGLYSELGDGNPYRAALADDREGEDQR